MISLTQTSFNDWVIDSGATDYMTFSKKDISEVKEPQIDKILNANWIEFQ